MFYLLIHGFYLQVLMSAGIVTVGGVFWLLLHGGDIDPGEPNLPAGV